MKLEEERDVIKQTYPEATFENFATAEGLVALGFKIPFEVNGEGIWLIGISEKSEETTFWTRIPPSYASPLIHITPDLTGAETILDKIDKAVEYLKGQ